HARFEEFLRLQVERLLRRRLHVPLNLSAQHAYRVDEPGDRGVVVHHFLVDGDTAPSGQFPKELVVDEPTEPPKTSRADLAVVDDLLRRVAVPDGWLRVVGDYVF